MMTLWKELLPDEYRDRLIVPQSFEYHRDVSAGAEKIIGFDAEGERCFSYHCFVLSEERFDADEFPLTIDTYYERAAAWRLLHGMWIRSKSFCDRLDRCNKRMTTLPIEISASAWEEGNIRAVLPPCPVNSARRL